MKKNVATGILLILAASVGFYLSHSPNGPPKNPSVPKKVQVIKKSDGTSFQKSQGMAFNPVTDTIVYDFYQHLSLNIDMMKIVSFDLPMNNTRPSKEHEARFFGLLHLRYIPKDADTWIAVAKFTDSQYTINGLIPSFAKALEILFAFDFRSNGSMENFRFTTGVPQVAQELVRGIVTGMQIILPEKKKKAWTTQENDNIGKFLAQYKVVKTVPDVTIEKHKLKYQNINTQDFISGDLSISIDSSKGVAVYDGFIGNRLKINNTEHMKIYANKTQIGSAVSQIDVKYLGPSAQKLPDSLSMLEKELASRKFIENSYYATDPEINRLMVTTKPGMAVSTYAEMFKKSRDYALQYLTNYLRLYPESCWDVVLQAENDLPHTELIVAWRALAEAGHGHAQKVIVDMFTDELQGDSARMRAIAYLHDLKNPSLDTVDATADFLRQEILNPHSAEDIRIMAAYAYGALARSEHIDSDYSEMILTDLVDLLGTASGTTMEIPLIHALGNHGNTDIVPVLDTYLESPDDNVRMATYESMSRASGDLAFQRLIESLAFEQKPKVRIRALQSIAAFSSHDGIDDWARDAIFSTQSEQEILAYIDILGRNVDKNDENAKCLQNYISKNGLSNKVKKRVYKYIAPQRTF